MKDFLLWLERFLTGFLVGYKVGESGKKKAIDDLEWEKFKSKVKDNIIQNEKDFNGKSDDDIIKSAIDGAGSDDVKPEGKE